MTDEEVLDLVTLEFKTKTLGVTEQYLEIHEPVYKDGQLKIDRIDREGRSNLIVAYLPVKAEYFNFAVYIDSETKEIFNVGTESGNIVSLRVSSENLTVAELQSLTKLIPTKSWDKGDLKPNGKSNYTYSYIEFTPNPEPDEFEDKLRKLLIFLQNDTQGIIALTKNANAYIQIIMDFHNGNQLLGSATLDLEGIKKLGELNLPVTFDVNAWGNAFK